MEKDPKVRSRNTMPKLVGAAAAGIAAVTLAFSQAEGSIVDCEGIINDPLSPMVCTLVDVGSSVKNALSEELSFQMRSTP